MLKRLLQGAVAVAVLASVALFHASPAAAATQGPYIIWGGWQSGKCIADPNASTANVTMIIYGCHDPATAEQEWWFIDTNSGYYLIQNRKSQKCLTVQGNATTNNAAVIQYNCNPVDNEQWYPVYQFTDQNFYLDAYVLVNRHSGRCLTVKNGSSSDSTPLLQFDCNEGWNQLWTWYTPAR